MKVRRKNRRQLESLKRKLIKDLIYFIFSGLIFTGILQSITPPIKNTYNTLTQKLEPIKRPTVKSVYAQEFIEPTPVQVAENWDEFIESAMKIAPIYNFPTKLLISQAAHESNRGLSQYARERNNYFGMCAYDWNPNEACWYENQEQGMIAYIVNIRETFPEAWENRDNPEKMLELIIHNPRGVRYATDPQYIQKVMNTPEWRNY